MITRKISLSLFLIFMLCLALPAFAGSIAEYTADMVDVKTGKVTQKFAVMPDKIYNEVFDDQGKSEAIVILRMDQRKMYIVMEETKSYMELPFDKDRFTSADLSMGTVQIEEEKVGSETVNGYKADKFRTTVQAMGMTRHTSYQWRAPEFEPMPVRTEDAEGVIEEMRNIKIGRPVASLFELPTGYKRDARMEQLMSGVFRTFRGEKDGLNQIAPEKGAAPEGQPNMDDLQKRLQGLRDMQGKPADPQQMQDLLKGLGGRSGK